MGSTAQLFRLPQSVLDGFIAQPVLFEEYLNEIEQGNYKVYSGYEELDIDKSWDGIYHLLQQVETVEPNGLPLAWAIFSEQSVDESQDIGHVAQYLTQAQVQALNNAWQPLATAEVMKHYDVRKMKAMDIYPDIWEGEEAADYLMENLEALKAFYSRAGQANEAVVVLLFS